LGLHGSACPAAAELGSFGEGGVVSNQACLFAEDTSAPYDPLAEKCDPGANTVQVAGAAYQIPAFWLACFDTADIAVVESEEGDIPQLVSELERVRFRLAEREAAVQELFPAHAAAWDEFRCAVEAAGRKYLKVDTYEIWMLEEDDGEFGRLLKKALSWFRSRTASDLDALLSLAGIEAYDSESKTFSAGDDDPKRFLYGWLEE
jgi:hypothetical protein